VVMASHGVEQCSGNTHAMSGKAAIKRHFTNIPSLYMTLNIFCYAAYRTSFAWK
jgi:hypothetical protein